MIKEKNGIKSYIQDFGELPLSIVFGFGEHDDQTSTSDRLYRPTRRLKLTSPIIPRMKEPSIVQAHKELENFHMKAQGSSNIGRVENIKITEIGIRKQKKTFFSSQSAFFEKLVSYETQ